MLFFRRYARYRATALPRQRGSLTKPLLALAALAILATSATAITYLLTARDGNPIPAAWEASSRPQAPSAPLFFSLQPFTVTISNAYAERLMHVGVSLKVSDQASRDRLETYLPVVRSQILMLLSEQDPEIVQTGQGKRLLAQSIREAANESLDTNAGQRVTEVLFTDFVVQ